MLDVNLLVAIILGISVGCLALFAWRLSTEVKALRGRFAGITDVDAELSEVGRRVEDAQKAKQKLEAETEDQRTRLSKEYDQALVTYNELKKEVSLLEENLEDISFGVYKPHFSYDSPDDYKNALETLRDRERQTVRDGQAAVCPIPWTVGDSRTEGKRMVRLHMKLLLRAFNGECEGSVSNVSWNNITKMEERLRKSFDAINKLGDVEKISITEPYLRLKLDELRLNYEYQQRRFNEREQQRLIREQMREEERAQREIEKAKEDAETEEARFIKALDKARDEVSRTTGAQLQKLTEQISSFEAKLDEARKKKERAVARAQLTKSGFVYVISNHGSFGDHVFKIGMTRRLEPMDRIYELGGASVPFPFDLHAMLYSDNAPELESALHKLFSSRRLNLVNARREFFKEIELDEIEIFVKERGLSAQFIKNPEAREYRETMALRQQRGVAQRETENENRFAKKLFEERETVTAAEDLKTPPKEDAVVL